MGLRIIDDEGRDVPHGEVGEIAAIGPSVHFGYPNNRAANRDSFTADGWFRTGDLGQFVDAEGNVRIAGRKKEIINRGGKKYFPREIEELLYQHPAILQVAIVGAPDARLGEHNCMCVVLKPGASLTLDEVVAFLSGRVADYKLPEELVVMDRPADDADRKDPPAGADQAGCAQVVAATCGEIRSIRPALRPRGSVCRRSESPTWGAGDSSSEAPMLGNVSLSAEYRQPPSARTGPSPSSPNSLESSLSRIDPMPNHHAARRLALEQHDMQIWRPLQPGNVVPRITPPRR